MRLFKTKNQTENTLETLLKNSNALIDQTRQEQKTRHKKEIEQKKKLFRDCL